MKITQISQVLGTVLRKLTLEDYRWDIAPPPHPNPNPNTNPNPGKNLLGAGKSSGGQFSGHRRVRIYL